MSLKSERDLNQTCRHQVNRAKDAAASKNYDYAISLLQATLKEEPLFLDGRRFMRRIEVLKYKALNTFSKQMLSMRLASSAMKLTSAGKKDPAEQLLIAEEVLALDPFHTKANILLADAGAALGQLEFKAFAYETLAEGKPDDKTVLHTLGNTYMELKEPVMAEKIFEKLLDLDPRDGEALSALKNASAAHASRAGNWETAKDYRDVLKSKAESEKLEQASKVVRSGSAIEEMILENFELHKADPSNPTYPKAIAQFHLQKNDYPNAIEWFQAAFDIGGKVDSAMEKTIGDLKLKKVEQEMQKLNEALAQATDPDQQATLATAIEEKKMELDEVRLYQAEALVRAYPNEGQHHYELGEALYKLHLYKRALPELQIGMRQPSVRHPAMNLMGLCFIEQGMYDLAVRRLSEASGELPVMDELKKEIVYNLGLAYEAIKQHDKALEECWKKIYEFDMGYRDVAQRVEDSYRRGQDT